MNRSNVGNIVTNATQTMAVSGFTAAGYVKGERRARLGDAASALNNLSEDEVRQLGEHRAEQARQEIREGKNVTSGVARLNNTEQQQLGEKRAEDLRSYIKGTTDDVDEVMEGSVYDSLKSPQAQELKTKANRDAEWIKQYKSGLAAPNPIDELAQNIRKKARGDKNADV